MSEIPLKPIGKEDIRRLESALLVMSLFSPETMEALGDQRERITWVDSLYTAAAAFARDKAGMSASQIADEIGVTEATVRKHIKGETKAGQLIIKAYEKLAKEGFRVELPGATSADCGELKERVERAKKLLDEVLKELGY